MEADDKRLTLAAAGALIGISGEAIRKAILAGRLDRGADGLVSTDDVLAYSRGRRTPRGGAHRNRQPVAASPQSCAATKDDELTPCVDQHGLARVAWTAAMSVRAGAADLAPLALRYLALPLAEELVQAWVSATLRELVGLDGNGPEPLCETELWPPPPAGGVWRDHPWFDPVQDAAWLDWPGAAVMASAWRAERGMPPL